MRIARLFKIVSVFYRFGLDDFLAGRPKVGLIATLFRLLPVPRDIDAPLPQRVRLALEHLGPIFIKFGQVLSTRRDLLPPDYADALAHLQDRVAPFDGALARQVIEQSFGQPVENLYVDFEITP